MPKESAHSPAARHGWLPALRAETQRQSWLIGAAAAGGAAIGLAGLALGGVTLWQGWSLGLPNFLVRGVAIVLVSALALRAADALLAVRSQSAAHSAEELADLGLRRAICAISVTRLLLVACALAAAFGLAGAAIRSAAGDPPALSPAIGLAAVLAGAFGLLLVGFRAHSVLLRFASLRRMLRRG